jgi:transcriptional regulator with XRE-family HTH domain
MSSTVAPALDVDEVIADIGDRVRAERQALGWSQAKLGQQAGMTPEQIRRLESGLVGLKNLLEACSAMNIEVSDLLSPKWRLPLVKASLTEKQVEVLSAAADGAPLSEVAVRLGMPREGMASHLSDIYRRFGIADMPLGERRAAAVRIAEERGLFNAA